MLTLPDDIVAILIASAAVFSARTFAHVQVLMTSATLTPGRQPLTNVLRAMRLAKEKHFRKHSCLHAGDGLRTPGQVARRNALLSASAYEHSMNILWVENHQQFSQVAVKHFLSAYRVTVVPSLVAARLALSHEQFDVVLLDYDLDDGKGTELAAEIKAQSHKPPLIATSSHATGNQLLVSAGADAVCSKLEFASIGETIERISEQPAT